MGFADDMLQTESTRVMSGRSSMDNGRFPSYTGRPKYKRRSVSAVRDFPPGCGPFAPRIFVMGEVALGVATGGNSTHDRSSDAIRDFSLMASGMRVSSPMVSVSPSLDPLETDSVQSQLEERSLSVDLSTGTESMNLEPPAGTLLPKAVEDLDDTGAAAWAKAYKETVPRNYPPRRRISAVRDFPPLCGRNAPRLGRGEDPKLPAFDAKKTGNEKLRKEEKPPQEQLKETLDGDMKQLGENLNADNCKLRANVSQLTGNIVPVECDGPAVKEARNRQESGAAQRFSPRDEIQGAQEGIEERGIKFPHKAMQNQRILEIAPTSREREILGLEESLGKDLEVSLNERGSAKELSDLLVRDIEKSDLKGSEVTVNRVVVQGLMAQRYCPWSQGKGVYESTDLDAGVRENKGKRNDLTLLKSSKSSFKDKNMQGENFEGSYAEKNSFFSGMAHQRIGAMSALDKKDGPKSDECDKFQLVRRPRNEGVNLLPSNPSGSSAKGDARNKVRETLRLFQAICRKLLQEEEAKVKGEGNSRRRIDLQAAKMLKENKKYVNTGKQIIGSVPGVEVGDEFQYFVELNIVGLHRPSQGGIDYLNQGMDSLATSIVASGGYDDDTDETDVLIYMGQGGNVKNGGKEPEDQELKRGNLALKNSRDAQNPVRVICGNTKVSDSSDSRGKTYIYAGLYLVEKFWQQMGPHGKLVYKFQLVRIPAQPELAWKVVKKSKKCHVCEGLCLDDISQGRESIAICAVNTIDDEQPPAFEYATRMIYPAWYHLIPPQGCNCNGKCFGGKCSCAAKNGGEIPYNHNGAIVEAKSIVYECGPSCKCPPSCYNRVSQHGIKFQLEIFKTDSRGWGVRSLNSIPSGSFICEYVGELLEEKEAEQKMGNDEYLFDIGHNSNDKVLWDGLSALMPEAQSSSCEVVLDGSFTIDAARCGNVGRFINHSCSPNLYAQDVLHDHEDKRMPHVMLFAAENIPPLQELTYHYNYMIDQVLDSDGNIKKKSCYCGSSECTGRMY